jgi:uncharacterized damage-inducible protein DinB
MENLIQKLKDYRRGILYVLKMIPTVIWEWKPEQSMRTTGALATHLACAPLSLLEGLKGNIPDEVAYVNLEKKHRPEDSQGLVKLYEDGLERLVVYLKDHLEDAHEKKIQFYYQTEKTTIYEEVFGELGHEWFHLGQLFIYLKQNGVPVDMGSYYGYKDPDPSKYPTV